MSESATPVALGQIGVWAAHWEMTPERAVEIERLGYRTIWVGGSPDADLRIVESLLSATSTLSLATGIVNIWSAEAGAVADSFHRLEAAYPGRFLLGIGAGHREATEEYTQPYQALVDYLDVLDELAVPKERRVLAALGPRVLRLAADRAAGAHPYLVTPEYTASARQTVGDQPLLAIEHKIALGSDHAETLATGRSSVEFYLGLSNYVANLRRLGYTEQDVAGSDELVDALVAQGTPAAAAEVLRAHLDAGADHVMAHVVPDADDPLPTLSQLATELKLS